MRYPPRWVSNTIGRTRFDSRLTNENDLSARRAANALPTLVGIQHHWGVLDSVVW